MLQMKNIENRNKVKKYMKNLSLPKNNLHKNEICIILSSKWPSHVLTFISITIMLQYLKAVNFLSLKIKVKTYFRELTFKLETKKTVSELSMIYFYFSTGF